MRAFWEFQDAVKRGLEALEEDWRGSVNVSQHLNREKSAALEALHTQIRHVRDAKGKVDAMTQYTTAPTRIANETVLACALADLFALLPKEATATNGYTKVDTLRRF